jgi:hypothetical protein
MALQLFINLDDYNRVVESNLNRIPIRAVRLKAQSTTDLEFRWVRNGVVTPLEAGAVFRFAAKASGERDSDPVLEELNSSFTVVPTEGDYHVIMSLNTNTTAMMELFESDGDPSNDVLLALLDAELLWESAGKQYRTPDPFLFEMENPIIRDEDLPPIDNPATYPDPTLLLLTTDLGVTVCPLVDGEIPLEYLPGVDTNPFQGATDLLDGTMGLVPAPLAGDHIKFLKGDGNWELLPPMVGADSLVGGSGGIVPAPVAGDNFKYLKGDGTWSTPQDTTYTNFTTSTPGLVPAPGSATGRYLRDNGTWDNPTGATTPFTGATPSANGTQGLVPAPIIGDEIKFLKGDGTWGTPDGQTYEPFTSTSEGLVPNPGSSSGRVLTDDGNWTTFAGTTLTVFGVEADGLVPGPLAGDTGKYLKGDGTWSTVPNFTTSVAGLVPAPVTSDGTRYLKDDGSWAVPVGTTYSTFNISQSGLVPAPVTAIGAFLRDDGTWTIPTNTTYSTFTTTVSGLVPAPTTATGKYLKDNGTWDNPVAAPSPTITDSTTARTLALSDANKYIRCTNAGAITITVPTDAGVNFPLDTTIYIRRTTSAGAITLSTTGVTVNDNDSASVPAGGTFALKKIAANTWDFI